MATRNERRKRQKAKAEGIAQWERSAYVTAVVKLNRLRPVERDYYAGMISTVYSGERAATAIGHGVTPDKRFAKRVLHVGKPKSCNT